MSMYWLPEFDKFKNVLPKERKTKVSKLKMSTKKDLEKWFVPVLILNVFLAAFAGFVLGALLMNHLFSPGRISFENFDFFHKEEPGDPSNISIVSEEDAIIETVERVSPSVVSIVVSKDMPVIEKYYYNPFKDFWGDEFGFKIPRYRQKGTEEKEIGGGTGFIVSPDGLILTNKHVVIDKEANYTVLTNDGRRLNATVLARDPFQDIAILKADTGDLSVIDLGDSDDLKIGQTVIAIGNVLGEFRNSVSVGVISGLRRDITASGSGFSELLEGIIQTDAAINKGNSGGPLLNLQGEVVGINTAMALEAENVGFAIPINSVKKAIEQVKESGEIAYAFLGIYYTLVTPALEQEYGLSVGYGAWVGRDGLGKETQTAVFPDSPAKQAGIQKDDIILEFNGEKINLENSLAKIIRKYNPGDSINIKLLRNKKEMNLDVVLDKRDE